jgi:hypothetical protein
MTCYFEPLSHCTLEDALRAASPSPDPLHTNGSDTQSGPIELLRGDEADDAVWSEAADRQLEQAVLRVGQRGPWRKIAAMVGKGQVSCQKRWFDVVRPNLMKRRSTVWSFPFT